MKLYIALSSDEIRKKIPYALICETRESSVWDTMRRRRLWNEWFSDKEKEASSRLFSQAHTWHLTKGVPDEVKMSVPTFNLWQKLGEFCTMI